MEKARQHSVVSRAEYKSTWLLAAFLFGVSIFLLSIFGPDDADSVRPTKIDGRFTLRGWLILAAGATTILWSIPHVLNILMRRPPMEARDGDLVIWMFPRERIPLKTITAIAIDNHSIEIRFDNGRERRLNTRMMDEPRFFFFDEVRPLLCNPAILFEKDK